MIFKVGTNKHLENYCTESTNVFPFILFIDKKKWSYFSFIKIDAVDFVLNLQVNFTVAFNHFRSQIWTSYNWTDNWSAGYPRAL